MARPDVATLSALSPFELRSRLIGRAKSHGERVMLNAGRGNPNFLAAAPRRGFFALGQFAMAEAERQAIDPAADIAGFPRAAGIAKRFAAFARTRRDEPGVAFLADATRFATAAFAFEADALLHELTLGILGCTYPEPARMLPHAEAILRRYLAQALGGPAATEFDLFAVEGATAGIVYVFDTLRQNRLIAPGDTIAIGTPIFAPYLEIPRLADYRLAELAVEADPAAGWQFPEAELDKLCDPRVKALLLVNPGNPTAVKIDDAGLARIATIVATRRPDLIIVSDDVYAGFADDFRSLFALCPRNTILIYSFSKYFGTTGWRLGAAAMARDNVIDARLKDLPDDARDARYAALVPEPGALSFIDRLVADSRAVALNHTAGLSTPQQVEMALFALYGLMEEGARYQAAVRRLIRGRRRALDRALGDNCPRDANATDYYAVLDFESLAAAHHGGAFAEWLAANTDPLELLFRLADEAGIVLLPGKGFATPHPSARISLANLDAADYRRIGRTVRALLADYAARYRAEAAGKPAPVPAER